MTPDQENLLSGEISDPIGQKVPRAEPRFISQGHVKLVNTHSYSRVHFSSAVHDKTGLDVLNGARWKFMYQLTTC